MATTMPSQRTINPVHLFFGVLFLGIGFASVAWTRLGIAIILPEVMRGIGVTAISIGGLISTFTVLGTGITEPFLGRLSDVINRRVALAVGLALFSLFCLLTAAVSNLPEMLIVRILLGVAQAMFIPAYFAFLGGAFGKRRGLILGSLGSLFSIGTALNPLMTQAIFNGSGDRWQAPSIVYGVFGLAIAVVVFALGRSGLYERGRIRKTDATEQTEAAAVSEGKTGLASRGMVLLMVTMVCWGLTQYGYLGLFVTFLRQQQHFTLGDAAAVASIAGWVSLVSAICMGWLSDRIGRRYVLLIGGVVSLVLSVPLFIFTGSFWTAVIIGSAFQSANGHFYPLGIAYAQDMARAHTLGGHSGAVSGIGHIMAGLAGLVAGSLAGAAGFAAVGWLFAVLSAIMVICVFLTVDPAYQARRAERQRAHLAVA